MSSRLAALIGGQKRLLGDVAHELSSPIARIKLGLAIIEHRVEEDKDLKKVQSVIEDAEHMSSLVSELLSFSRAEINPQRVELSPVSLHAVIEKAVRREQTEQAPITCHVDPELRAQAHAELLVRALSNLLRNAVRYASAGGPIEVIACQQDNHVLIEVKDHGPGVPEGLLEQLFAPFFRPEPSRDRKTGGAGLGLAIVKTCVEACKGSVVARNRKPNGLSVTISLDAAT